MNKQVSRRSVLQSSMAATFLSAVPAVAFAEDAVYKPAVPGRPVPGETPYDEFSTAEQVTAGMDLAGRTVLVTGCNSGLGYETMRVLAMRGAHVIGAARTMEKAATACAGIEGKTTPLVVELTDFSGIVAAANQVADMDVPVDMLILNAGIMAVPELRQSNGIELQFAVNHLGHFLLANRLRDQVTAAKQGRVVVVSSAAHKWGPKEGIQFDNLSGEEDYDPFRAYGQSKVANGLFSREFARRLASTNATSNSLHPGVIKTNLGRFLPPEDESDDEPRRFRYKTIPEGTATTCYVATNPDLARVTGYYFYDCNPAVPNEHMQDDVLAAKLWEVSEELTADYLS
jgi:NAD(P)-dependent dehydrogenase (short-subunit alcohol dehydrogenase family)